MDFRPFASYDWGSDSTLELYDAAGTRLGMSTRLDAEGVRAGISFTAAMDGSAYVVARPC